MGALAATPTFRRRRAPRGGLVPWREPTLSTVRGRKTEAGAYPDSQPRSAVEREPPRILFHRDRGPRGQRRQRMVSAPTVQLLKPRSSLPRAPRCTAASRLGGDR